jgi:hypothetical protein
MKMTKVMKKLVGVSFFGLLGVYLLWSGAYQVGHTATEHALSVSGLIYMLAGGVGVVKALMVATRS